MNAIRGGGGRTIGKQTLTNLFILTQCPRTFAADSLLQTPSITPVDSSHLLRVCTVLYQQQNAPDKKLHSRLDRCDFNLSHEFFLQVCNKFPYSWRPVYRFFQFTETKPHFNHTSISLNKMIDVIGKSHNIDLLWGVLREIGQRRLANGNTFRIGIKTLASSRDLRKCVEFFHIMNRYGCSYSLDRLNMVVETLCKSKHVNEAKHIVVKLRDYIKPDGITYKHLISGFCETGDLIEASKVWNLMVDEGFEPDINAVEKMIETQFKKNQFVEGLKIYQMLTTTNRINDLGLSTYKLLITWLCKKEKFGQAHHVFEEMRERGIEPDNAIIGSMIYGLLTKTRIREAYMVMEKVENPDINIYHGMIKGFLRLKRRKEATDVFREMIKRGCEPIMHTYVMLIQGHMGKRGRKGDDPLVNFDSIFVGGLIKAGKSLEATKYVERMMNRKLEVPRFDYNKFLHYFSNEEGAVMFEDMSKKLREVGLFDLADVFSRYGEKMATRDRRRDREKVCIDSTLKSAYNSGESE
ncbi:putative pentatricopeptide repeat-containing protein At1g26500 [Impatiens glandulifera]|uniref:putative pentatricopeptide repeat-containing protein At1g26500 n=1 Tax=Impatiens glandulifera TaxID=253017 RepID=UPI001FB0FB41|nr:putative pentatricopeptide repeat-containing protein At1g26500 [Impatiens glandulifera]